MNVFNYLGGLFLGWSVGANDSANMFGTAVAAHMVRYRTAVLLIALGVVAGAVLQGHHGIETVSSLSDTGMRAAVVCTFAAAGTVTLMSLLKIPVSTSQMMISALVGLGLYRQNANLEPLAKILLCWMLNPVGAMLVTALLYLVLHQLVRWLRPSVFTLDPVLRLGLVVCGCYGAYALGANGVAIVCAVFVGDGPGMVSANQGALLGGIAIGIGAITYSKRVMMTVGKGVVHLDALTAFIAVLSLAVTVHIFALIGVPVSTSQTIVGGLLGISLVKGLQIVNLRQLARILVWWLVSPVIAGVTAIGLWLVV